MKDCRAEQYLRRPWLSLADQLIGGGPVRGSATMATPPLLLWAHTWALEAGQPELVAIVVAAQVGFQGIEGDLRQVQCCGSSGLTPIPSAPGAYSS